MQPNALNETAVQQTIGDLSNADYTVNTLSKSLDGAVIWSIVHLLWRRDV
jgi:hypothetical protein